MKVEGFEFYFVFLVLLATDTDQQFVVFRHVTGECLARMGEREVCLLYTSSAGYYRRFEAYKGTQFVFSDLGTYKPG